MLSTTSISLIIMGCAFVVALVYFLYTIIVLKKKIAAQKGNLDTEKNALELELSKTLENKDALIQILNNNISSLENKIKNAEEEKKRILQEKNQDEEKISAVLSSDNAKVLKDFQEKNAKLKKLNDDLANERKKLDADIKNSKFDISSLTAQLKASQEKACENVAEFERVSGELEKVKATNIDLADKLKKTEKENINLKNKNEDLEDDIDDLEKKNEKNKEEISSLKDNLENLSKKNKSQSERIGELSEELNGTKANLSNKQKALIFVQEILSAKENPDNVTKEHRKVINEINSFMNDSLFELMKVSDSSDRTVAEIENLKNEFNVWQNLEKKNWLKNKRTIAFVGEFSAGKTSIVNTILLQNDRNAATLPENSKATTAIPTYISNTSGRSSFAFLTPNNQLKMMSETTFKMVDKEVLENVKGTSSLIKYFVMSYNNKSLSDLSILDTPGFDSNDPEDAMRTIEVINECDALFWVIDVNKGELNKTSIKTIKENLHRPLFIVINKVDTKNPEGVETFKKKIKETLANSGISYEKIISFSKKEKASEILKYLNSVNKASVEVNAIESIRNIMKKYKRDIHSKVVKCKSLAESARGEGSNTSAQFTRSVNNLIKKCETVGDIPSWNEHWFSANVYEMSPTQHSAFEKGLDDIKNISKKTKELYEKRMDIEKDIVSRSKEFQDKVQLELKWDELISVFERHAQQFNMSNH